MISLNWKPIVTAPKGIGKFVLLAKDSGYVGYPWNYLIGHYEHDRYPGTEWRDIAGDAIEPQPSYWTDLPNPPEPTTNSEEPQGEETVTIGGRLPILRLYCTEGFSYSGYQRVIAQLEGEAICTNVSREVANLYNALYRTRAGYPYDEGEILQLGEDGRCFYVLSGESLTLQDVEEGVVQDTLRSLYSNTECIDRTPRVRYDPEESNDQ